MALQIHIGERLEKMVESFIAEWVKAEKGIIAPERQIVLGSYEGFARVSTPRRIEQMKALCTSGPMYLRALLMLVKRDYKSVHGDVAKLWTQA